MIKDIIAQNENAALNSKEIEILKTHFSSCFNSEGEFDIERFKGLIGDEVSVIHEGYELKFLGKNYARLLASTETETVIAPDKKHNSLPENKNSSNVYISADNLDALKHLKKSYEGAIKCIYIDPPYNTGTDGFVYKDNFGFTAEELSDKLSIDEEQAQRILNFTKKGSASHSAWLMFMYPRLALARDLLTIDGVIFISIDDNEQANLKLICDEIFGEENFIAEFPRITKKSGKSSNVVAKNHDYLLMYSKSSNPLLYPIEHNDSGFKYKDEFFEERGLYKLNQTLDYDSLQYSKSLDYPLEIDGETYYAGSSKVAYEERQQGFHNTADWAWRWSKKMFDFGYANGFIVIKSSKNGKRIYTKTYQNATIDEDDNGYFIDYGDRTKSLSTLETVENIYSNDNAKKDALKTIGKAFEHPKPLSLLSLIVRLCTRSNDTILDFFSGSATTAETIMRLNCEYPDIKRKFIMVQLPEQCKNSSSAYKDGYRTICDIGMRRISVARENLLSEYPGTVADLGFKHYTLKEVAIDTLDKLDDFNDASFLENNLLDEFGVPTVLTTWLIRDGYGFSAPVQAVDFEGYTAYYCKDHLYLLNEGISDKAIAAAAEKLGADKSFTPKNIVLFGYSFNYTQTESLKTNLKLVNDKLKFDVRY